MLFEFQDEEWLNTSSSILLSGWSFHEEEGKQGAFILSANLTPHLLGKHGCIFILEKSIKVKITLIPSTVLIKKACSWHKKFSQVLHSAGYPQLQPSRNHLVVKYIAITFTSRVIKLEFMIQIPKKAISQMICNHVLA